MSKTRVTNTPVIKTRVMKEPNKVIDRTETTKDGIETVRCGDTLMMLGKSFIQDGVRYFVPMCPHPKEYETITVRGRFCSLCETKSR